MSAKGRIREGLISLFKQANPSMSAFSAEVLSVDIANRTCSVRGISDETGTEYPNVWLMPEVADGLLYVPKVGSTVIVENNASLQPYVVMWSELDKVLYIVNNTTLSITDGLTQFNKGDFGGILKVDPSVKAWNDTQKDINNLKLAMAAFQAAAAATTTTPVTGTSLAGFISSAFSTYNSQTLTLTAKTDVEDKAVTH